MKLICLPYVISITLKILSYIFVLLLDIIHFILTPFTWIKFKAHLFMISIAGVGYLYLRFFIENSNALLIALIGLFAVISAVILIKIFRKKIHFFRQCLIKIVYTPLDYCFYIKTNNSKMLLAK